ncbi:MAG TPA: hypothetical protein VJT77_04695, partial [Burkholderiales bacterium]|nr:hypothetical protein [Burkholderiales bacterium]
YVLHPPREDETELISAAVERSLAVWPLIFAGDMEGAMHRLHTTTKEPKDSKDPKENNEPKEPRE